MMHYTLSNKVQPSDTTSTSVLCFKLFSPHMDQGLLRSIQHYMITFSTRLFEISQYLKTCILTWFAVHFKKYLFIQVVDIFPEAICVPVIVIQTGSTCPCVTEIKYSLPIGTWTLAQAPIPWPPPTPPPPPPTLLIRWRCYRCPIEASFLVINRIIVVIF